MVAQCCLGQDIFSCSLLSSSRLCPGNNRSSRSVQNCRMALSMLKAYGKSRRASWRRMCWTGFVHGGNPSGLAHVCVCLPTHDGLLSRMSRDRRRLHRGQIVRPYGTMSADQCRGFLRRELYCGRSPLRLS